MKKLVILSLALTAVFTACKDRDQTPAPTGIGKIPTLPVDTIDIRDIAAGTFVDSVTNDNVIAVTFVTDTNSIDEMFMYNNGQIIDTLSIEGEDWGFVFFGRGFPRVPFNSAGYYELEADAWHVRIVPEPADTLFYTFKRVN